MSLYLKALKIAHTAHGRQNRKQSCVPYIVHPIRVAGYFNDDIKRAISVLHDVVEDTSVKIDDLRGLFPLEVTTALVLLSRKKGEAYFEYIERIKQNEITTEIKIADIVDNLSDTICVLPQSMIDKYKKALDILIA